MKVLVAEDDLTSRTMLSFIVKKWGFMPIEVEDGKKALLELQKEDGPKIALLDWSMPEMDGLEVVQKIRLSVGIQQPYIIFITTKGDKEDVLKGISAKANDYILKPYDENELRLRLEVARHKIEIKQAVEDAVLKDPLTGVLNRGPILNYLENKVTLANRDGNSLAIGIINVENITEVNKENGHRVGDDLLCEFTKLLQSRIRSSDCIGRYGGDQFLIVSYGIATNEIEPFFRQLHNEVIKETYETRGGPVSIKINLGVVIMKKESNVDSLLTDAENALEIANRSGQNKIVFG